MIFLKTLFYFITLERLNKKPKQKNGLLLALESEVSYLLDLVSLCHPHAVVLVWVLVLCVCDASVLRLNLHDRLKQKGQFSSYSQSQFFFFS